MEARGDMKVRDVIERDLADEPQGVVRVYETDKLAADLREYVLEDPLPREFAKVLEPVVESVRPAGEGTEKIGIWVSGFFGTGKSHFAKIAGHLLADTPVEGGTARSLFAQLLHPSRPDDQRLRELLQEAATYRLKAHLVPFDIQTQHVAQGEANDAALTFLRALYASLGLSTVLAFAERELELQTAGLYDQFLSLYQERAKAPWAEEKDLTTSSNLFANCLAELLPERYGSPELAHESLQLALHELHGLNVEGVVDKMLRWLSMRERQVGAPLRLVFVADEVGAWVGHDLKRIESLRSLVELAASKGKGKIWLIVTSQERLSAVVQNTPFADGSTAQHYQQRLEARFPVNIHLESSGVGTVIEERILRKRQAARPELVRLFDRHEGQLADIAEPPGLNMGGNYPRPERDRFVADYPFLPYQLPAAADLFGGMRGVRVGPGARSMIRVAFDALRELAARDLGAVVSWDRIFDAANRENEFADEQYLGSQGLEYIGSADRDFPDEPIRPSRLLKVLWLVQQSPRIPRTTKNLARLLVDSLDADVLALERQVEATLQALEGKHYVRREAGTDQWRFLTQEQVTIERIVEKISVREKEVRDELDRLFQARLASLAPGRITMGQTNTAFEYGVFWADTPLKHEEAPVRLVACLEGSSTATQAAEQNASNLEEPVVWWLLARSEELVEKVRRLLAIGRLRQEDEFRRVATARLEEEARRLEEEAAELRRGAERHVEEAFERGQLLWGGQEVDLRTTSGGESQRSKVEHALRNRLELKYHRFADADRPFNPGNIEKLLSMPPGERADLDPRLNLFTPEGHVRGGDPLVEEIAKHLAATTKTAGREVIERFSRPPFGWPADLIRYAAAAMFVDGRLSVTDKAGRRYDDPRAKEVRTLFGTQAFKDIKLEIEEEALTPQEADTARKLLIELGHKPQDPSEVALKDACVQVRRDLDVRLALLDRARDAGLPLPAIYDQIPGTLEAADVAGPRVKVIRAFIEHADDLRAAKTALDHLAAFEHQRGFAQFRRAIRLRDAALQAGLVDEAGVAADVRSAIENMDAIIRQRRVLEEWEKAFQQSRLKLITAFKSVYRPLREATHRRVADARRQIEEMPEYKQLSTPDRLKVRLEYLAEGKPLAEIPLAELENEEQLVAAHDALSISHLRAILAAVDAQVAAARARVLELAAATQAEPTTVVWNPAKALGHRRFTTEAEVDLAFDTEKERLKALIRQGKIIEVP
jgi:hypothetical protein